ncbi:hypothetical protein Tco_0282196 [Tanacetum coccineum]
MFITRSNTTKIYIVRIKRLLDNLRVTAAKICVTTASINSKSGSWDQFGSQVAIALICLTEGRRFLQMILEIEPKNTKQYHAFKLTSKMFANMRLNFQGDHMPLLGTMLPPAQAAIAGESSGEAAPSNPQTVPKTITKPDHSHDHESTPPRPTTTTSSAPVNEQGPSSDPNIAPSSRPHESAPDLFTSTNVQPQEVLKDLDKTNKPVSSASVHSWQKRILQESEFKAHKLLFKEVVGKLVKKVKLLEDKLKAVPTGVHHALIFLQSSFLLMIFAGGSLLPAGAKDNWSFADLSNKGKSPLLEEDPPVRERTFRQKEEDRLGRVSLKIPGADLEQPSSKKSKPTEAPQSSVPDDSQTTSEEAIRLKMLFKFLTLSISLLEEGDPNAEHKLCIKYASDADSASDDDTPVNLHAVVDWEFIAIRDDKKAAGVGLVLWGDLKVLIDSPEVNDGSDVWKNQHTELDNSNELGIYLSYTGVIMCPVDSIVD